MSNEVSESKKNDEVSLLDLLGILIRYKWVVYSFTTLVAVAVFLFCLISIKLPPERTYLPNLYKPKAAMLINDTSASSGVSSALNSSGLGGLASILGASSSGPSNSSLAQYLVSSPSIQDAIIDKFYRADIESSHIKQIEELKAKGKYEPEKDNWIFPLTATRDSLSKKIETSFSSSTGVFTISVEDKDPQLACDIINFTVDLLEKRFVEIGIDKNKLSVSNLEKNIDIAYNNILDLQKKIKMLDYSLSNPSDYYDSDKSFVMDINMLKLELGVQEQIYSSLKTQYESLKVSMASEKPVFQILEYAQIPDVKTGPSRGKLCVLVTFAAFFFSICLVYFINFIKKLKADPEAMKKLHPNKYEGVTK